MMRKDDLRKSLRPTPDRSDAIENRVDECSALTREQADQIAGVYIDEPDALVDAATRPLEPGGQIDLAIQCASSISRNTSVLRES
jgi:hypothetical protein